MPLAGRPMVEWSLAAFRASESVGSIVVACPPGHAHELNRVGVGAVDGGDLVAVDGGATRSDSVSNALAAVDTELVAIHDAARPLVTPQLIGGVVSTLFGDPEADGAIAAAPVTDTVKRVSSDAILETVDRVGLWAAQTPQVFRVEALRGALEAYPDDAPAPTDEAMLVEAAGGRVLVHPSSSENFKVTTPLDLMLAELLLADR